ncbi:MAG: tetratricopeptide repeat protein [Bacteroidota bacterium]
MKRSPLFFALILFAGWLVAGAGCSSDPNIEGAKLDLRNKDYDRALENVATAIETNPENGEAYALKVQIISDMLSSVTDMGERTARVQEMREAYDQALALGAGGDATQRMRITYVSEFQSGIDAFNRGSEDSEAYDQAVAFFDNVIIIAPDSAAPYLNTAFALINAGQTDGAIDPLAMAIEKGENDPDSYIYLASLYRSSASRADGDQAAEMNQEAITVLEEARELYPDNPDIRSELLNAYVGAGRADEAMQAYADQVASDPENALYRFNYGTLLLQAEDFDAAIEQLSAATSLDDTMGNAFYNLGAAFTNKASEVNLRLSEMDDQRREQQGTASSDELASMDEQIETLVTERNELFEMSIDPLERARALLSGNGEDVSGVCQALFQAYFQIGEEEKGREAATCAGIDL